MKKIKIDQKNSAKIETELKAVNGSSTEHVYTSFYEIKEIVQRAEQELAAVILPKALWPGAVFGSTSGNKMPNAYKYARKATGVTITRFPSGWFLTSVQSATIYKEGGRNNLTLTPKQAEEAAKRFLRLFSVASTTV